MISQTAIDTDIKHRGSIARIAISLGDISSCVATTEKWAGATKGNSGTNFGRENSLGSWKAKVCPKVRLYFSLGSGKLNRFWITERGSLLTTLLIYAHPLSNYTPMQCAASQKACQRCSVFTRANVHTREAQGGTLRPSVRDRACRAHI